MEAHTYFFIVSKYWSRKIVFVIVGITAFFSLGLPAAFSSSSTTKYLAFQVFIGAFDPTVPIGGSGINPLSPPPPKAAISEFVQDIIDRIGVKGNEQTKLAFIEGPFCFDHSDSDISRVVREAFEIALEKDIAVGFHIDDSMFWARRIDLWRDPNNIEWLDWDGTVNTGRKIDWGQPEKLAPQMCFNSKAIQAEVRRRATDVIGKAIKEGIDKLRQEGKEELFAGAIVGWETQIGRDFDSNKFLGYCALTNRGFNKNNPPQDLDAEREKAVQEFIELWAKGIFDAGINPDKIYAHTAFLSKKIFDIAKPDQNYSEINSFAPPSVAFGKYHNPGFSTYHQSGLMEQVYEELAAHNNPHWASSEGTNLQLGYGPGGSGMNMETYLAKMFNHGAILVNIFAWGIGGEAEKVKNNPFRIATEGKEAIGAYQKFLKGEELVEQISAPPFSMEQLAAKVQKVQKEAPVWVHKTGNQAKVESLLQKLDQYIKEQNFREAERMADEILELIGSK